ncbi:MAG: hypothetical protein CK424_04800 [Legionella sp.]|nr:MAG: hypothetical protein CK424_04800 [Legionella sp.]
MKRTTIICLLILVFAAPGIAAYFAYTHPNWWTTTTNHGQLLQPPPVLHHESITKKWQLIYWGGDHCDVACRKRLDDLARVRLALGRRLYHVDMVLAVNAKTSDVSEVVQHQLQQVDGHILLLDEVDAKVLGATPAIYIVNPAHFVILAYSATQPNDDIFQDLKKMVSDT